LRLVPVQPGGDTGPGPDPVDNRPALTGSVSIDNTSPHVDDTLTATYSNGNGSGDPHWQWLRDDSPIPGANSSTYKVVQADIGHVLAIQVSFANQKLSVKSTATVAVAGTEVPPSSITVNWTGSKNFGLGEPLNSAEKAAAWTVTAKYQDNSEKPIPNTDPGLTWTPTNFSAAVGTG